MIGQKNKTPARALSTVFYCGLIREPLKAGLKTKRHSALFGLEKSILMLFYR